MVWLRENLTADAIVTLGAGNFAGWVHRFYYVRKLAGWWARPRAPWATACRRRWRCRRCIRERTVVCMAGDGDFLMTGQDFATAVQYKLPVIVVIYDNGLYGTIRMHQEREYPGRVIATQLHNPDFVAYAQAFGGFGVKVEKTADFPAAFEAARKSGKPSIIQLKVDPEAITPGLSLTQIREKSLAGGGGKQARIGVEGLPLGP